jgi:hypothetical protein
MQKNTLLNNTEDLTLESPTLIRDHEHRLPRPPRLPPRLRLPPQNEPTLAFLAFDESSRTTFTEEGGFVSGGFRSWPGGALPPFNPGTADGKAALAYPTNIQLSLTGGASACKSSEL